MAAAQPRTRNFCFTSHVGKIEFKENMRYLVMGEEIGGETEKEHIQGFVIFNNPRVMTGIIEEFPGVHWEIIKGTPKQNEVYCKKDGKWEEFGTPPKKKGERTDLIKIGKMVRDGMSDRDILTHEDDSGKDYAGQWIRNYRGIAAARLILDKKPSRNWKMDVRIYWGESDTGKTRLVHDLFGDSLYTKTPGRWWDGYNGEETILIDDFDPTDKFDLSFDYYLKLLDRYKMQVEYKGGFVDMTSKRIIITSNYDPKGWFLAKHNRNAFFRRVDTIAEFKGLGGVVEEIRNMTWD